MKKSAILLSLLLIIGLLVGCTKEMQEKEEKKQMDRATNQIKTRTPTEAEMGVPVYPNAFIEMDDETTCSDEMYSEDDFEAVVAWYREKLSGMPGFRDTTMASDEGDRKLFTMDSPEGRRAVSISRDGGRTLIRVATATPQPTSK